MIATCGIFIAMSAAIAADDGLDPLANGIGADVTAGSGWSINEGVLTPERGEDRSYVVTNVRFDNAEITLEFNPEAGTNSGVFARCQDPEAITPESCYEFNIWDAHPNQDRRTGAIVMLSPPTAMVGTEDQWNFMRIRLEGTRLQVWVNDTLTNDITHDQLSEGHIAFQYGGDNGMVLFRNISIKELP